MAERSVDRAQTRIETFEDFWLAYLQSHSKPATRALHYLGTGVGLLGFVAFVVTANPWYLPAALAVGYALAAAGHLLIEGNQPALFIRPFWALACDYRMSFSCLTGHLAEDLDKAGVNH